MDIGNLMEADPVIETVLFAFEKKCSLSHRLEMKKGRPCDGLVYVLDGEAVFETPEGSFEVVKDDIVYLREGSRYTTTGRGKINYHYIVISFSLHFNRASGTGGESGETDKNTTENKALLPGPDFVLPLRQVIKPANKKYYRAMFHEITEKWYYKGPLYKLKCKAVLSEMLYSLVQESLQEQMNLGKIKRILPAVEYMEKYYDRKIEAAKLAETAEMSIPHFRRTFRQLYGVPPAEYINNIRIIRAKDMLRSGMYSVGEVAAGTGFKNIYYFSRFFKKNTGVPPSGFM